MKPDTLALHSHLIDEIIVGSRRRKDMGDIDALAASISEIGLFGPQSRRAN